MIEHVYNLADSQPGKDCKLGNLLVSGRDWFLRESRPSDFSYPRTYDQLVDRLVVAYSVVFDTIPHQALSEKERQHLVVRMGLHDSGSHDFDRLEFERATIKALNLATSKLTQAQKVAKGKFDDGFDPVRERLSGIKL